MSFGLPLNELQDLRRSLHSRPEVSGNEKQTAATLVDFLKPIPGIRLQKGIGGHGLVAVFPGAEPGPAIAFRADLDGLDIVEVNDLAYRSKNRGKSHTCGHDGHMAILAGLARWLGENPPGKGEVILVFQPAEETGEGAERMLRDPAFSWFKPDFIYALHNLPGFPKNEIIVREEIFSAYVRSLLIRLSGRTSHAAEPEFGKNPASVMALLLHAAGRFTQNQPESADFRVVTPVYARLGEKAYGVAAGAGEVHFTLRTWSESEMEKISKLFLHIADTEGNAQGLRVKHNWKYTFYPTLNHPEALHHIVTAAGELGLTLRKKTVPFKWGEDFGMFTRHFRGAMFGLGAGEESPALHNPDYDFPDELIPAGAGMFIRLIQNHLSE